MVARICLPLVSLWTALSSGWRSSPHAFSLEIDRSRQRTLQQRNDIYGLENVDKMQPCISWSTSRAVPMSCTALEMRCNAEIDIQIKVGAAADDVPMRSLPASSGVTHQGSASGTAASASASGAAKRRRTRPFASPAARLGGANGRTCQRADGIFAIQRPERRAARCRHA